MQQHQNSANPYAQIVSNLNKDNPYASFMENIQQNNGDISKSPIIYSNPTESALEAPKQTSSTSETVREAPVHGNPTAVQNNAKSEPAKPSKAIEKPLLPLVQYDSDDDSDDDVSSDNEEEKREETPPEEMQVVIDKMASYVSKNGTDFEAIVKSKGDARFEFLNDSHKYHGYYKKKLQGYLKGKDGASKGDVPVLNKVKPKKVIGKSFINVFFYIKKILIRLYNVNYILCKILCLYTFFISLKVMFEKLLIFAMIYKQKVFLTNFFVIFIVF